MKVSLTVSELLMAANIGIKRHMEALKKGLPDKHGFDGQNGWTVHIEGAAGELAVAKALNVYWAGTVNTFKTGADVGSLHVRTRSKDNYELLVRDNDLDDGIFIHVTGLAPHYNVVGYLLAAEAKNKKWLREHGDRPAAYFVPNDQLKNIEDLKLL